MTNLSTQRFLIGEAGRAGWDRERQARYVFAGAYATGMRVLDLTPSFGSEGRIIASTGIRYVTWHSSRRYAERYVQQAGPSVSSIVAPSARSFVPNSFDLVLALDPSHDLDIATLTRSASWSLREGGTFLLAAMNDEHQSSGLDVTSTTQVELFDVLSPRFRVHAMHGQGSEVRATLARTQPLVTCLPNRDIAVQAATVTSKVTVDSLYLIALAEKRTYQP